MGGGQQLKAADAHKEGVSERDLEGKQQNQTFWSMIQFGNRYHSFTNDSPVKVLDIASRSVTQMTQKSTTNRICGLKSGFPSTAAAAGMWLKDGRISCRSVDRN